MLRAAFVCLRAYTHRHIIPLHWSRARFFFFCSFKRIIFGFVHILVNSLHIRINRCGIRHFIVCFRCCKRPKRSSRLWRHLPHRMKVNENFHLLPSLITKLQQQQTQRLLNVGNIEFCQLAITVHFA